MGVMGKLEKQVVMSWISTVYLEAIDFRIISQDEQRHSLCMKKLPSLAIIDKLSPKTHRATHFPK